MDNVLLSLSDWIKSIIKDTITRLVEIEKDSDHYPELMDVGTTCEFLGMFPAPREVDRCLYGWI